MAGALGAIEHTVEVTDTQLLASWAAEQQQRQHMDLPQQHPGDGGEDAEEDEDDDDADSAASTRSLLSSLRLSSSLSSSADYSALLSYMLSDVIERYDLAITAAYKLAALTPDAIHITNAHADDNDEDEQEDDGGGGGGGGGGDDSHAAAADSSTVAQQQAQSMDSTEQQSAASGLPIAAHENAAQHGAAQSESRRGKRQLAHDESATAELHSHKQQRTTAHADDTASTAALSADEWSAEQPHSAPQDDAASDASALPIVSPPVFDDSGGVLRSARFLSALASHFRLEGGVDYQQLVDGLVTALDSALFSAATAAAATPADSSPACATLLQLLLDLPLLPPAVWSCIDRYLSAPSSSAVGLLAVRVLIDHRPPASARAMRLLLRYAAVGASAQLRQRCVDVAVDCIASAAAPTQLRAIVVQRALSMAAAVCEPAFLADLPSIAVNIVVPPPPQYDDIQLPPTSNQHTQHTQDAAPATAGDGAAADSAAASASASGAGSVDSSISSLLSAVVGGGGNGGGGGFASSDGSEEADEARRRAIQQLIADGARRKKEFDKLVLRRQLLVKEKELRERQAEERQQQRRHRTTTHLALLIALLHSSQRIAFEPGQRRHSAAVRASVECVCADGRSGAGTQSHPLRTARHRRGCRTFSALAAVASVAASSVRSLCVARAAVAVHSAALVGGLAQQQQQRAVTRASDLRSVCGVLVSLPHSAWRRSLHHSHLLPMLRAEQLRRCLHRIVALPAVHLRVALHRMLRPQATLSAKGNRLSQPHPQPLLPAELVVALHRIDQHRRHALTANAAATNNDKANANANASSADQKQPSTQPQSTAAVEHSTEAAAAPPLSLPLSSPLPATTDLSICPSSSAITNYPSDDGAWLRSLIAAVQLCFASVDLFPASTLASALSALRVDRPLSRLFLRTCIQCVQLQPSLVSFVLSVVHSLVRSERSMVGVSLLWEGVLKLASLSLPASLDLLLDLPDEGVARLFGSLSPAQLLSTLQAADSAAADAAADKAAGRKAGKQAASKQTPLQMCQLAGGQSGHAAAAQSATRLQKVRVAAQRAAAVQQRTAGQTPTATAAWRCCCCCCFLCRHRRSAATTSASSAFSSHSHRLCRRCCRCSPLRASLFFRPRRWLVLLAPSARSAARPALSAIPSSPATARPLRPTAATPPPACTAACCASPAPCLRRCCAAFLSPVRLTAVTATAASPAASPRYCHEGPRAAACSSHDDDNARSAASSAAAAAAASSSSSSCPPSLRPSPTSRCCCCCCCCRCSVPFSSPAELRPSPACQRRLEVSSHQQRQCQQHTLTLTLTSNGGGEAATSQRTVRRGEARRGETGRD